MIVSFVYSFLVTDMEEEPTHEGRREGEREREREREGGRKETVYSGTREYMQGYWVLRIQWSSCTYAI